MTRTDVGFFIFLSSAFLAPEVPFGDITASPGIVGMGVWALLGALNLPLGRVSREAWFVAGAVFAVWAVVVPSQSPLSILYAFQQLLYLVCGGILVRAYGEARPERFAQITAVVAGLYAAALIVSWRTGPFYPWQMGFYTRGDLLRAAGTASSVNEAGGVAAVFCLLMFGQGRRWLVILCLVALTLTFSRSAAVAFVCGAIVLSAHWFFRGRERRSIALLLTLMATVTGILLVMPESAGYDLTAAIADTVQRSEYWYRGVTRWQEGTTLQLFVGQGLHSSSVTTSHSLYIELLADLGMIGLLLFLLFIAASLWDSRYSAASTGGLIVLLVHNATERFLHHPDMMLVWLLCLAGAPGVLCRAARGRMYSPRREAVHSERLLIGRAGAATRALDPARRRIPRPVVERRGREEEVDGRYC